MKIVLRTVSWIALSASILPAILYMNDVMPLGAVKTCMLISTVVWFVTTPFWMDKA
jgi:hypothetical protein